MKKNSNVRYTVMYFSIDGSRKVFHNMSNKDMKSFEKNNVLWLTGKMILDETIVEEMH